MTDDRWVEYAAAMYVRTKQALVKRLDGKPLGPEVISVFEQACSFDRGERAGKQRMDERVSREQRSEELMSEKQRNYIEALGGDPERVQTRKEASDYIEELRRS